MSTVHVLVGQCGNQLGTSFLDSLAEDAAQSRDETYQMLVSSTHFRPAMRSRARAAHTSNSPHTPDSSLPQPRCVMVDMEPKVIEEAVQRVRRQHGAAGTALYSLAPQQCVTRGEGSGNNWAYGYLHQGASRRAEIEECLRREFEMKETTIGACHVVHSVAGGTGSGVSCVVADILRDCFPRTSLIHTLVWPFHGGEVVTQWYNAVLCMRALNDTVDGAFVVFNDHVANDLQVQGVNRGVAALDQVSFDAMNRRIAGLVAPLHLPQMLYSVPSPQEDMTRHRIQSSSNTWFTQNQQKLHRERPQPLRTATVDDALEALTLDPQMKFFTGCAVPDRTVPSTTWGSVLGDAARVCQETFTTHGVFGGGTASSAAGKLALPFYGCGRSSLWCLRGRGAMEVGIDELRHAMATSTFAPFPLTQLYVSPFHSTVGEALTPSPADPQVTLYGATPDIGRYLTTALTRVETLLSTGAFLHHFTRYGVSKEDIQDAAACLWDTVAAYSADDAC